MSSKTNAANERKLTSVFERYLTVWVGLSIVGGILLGRVAPGVAKYLDSFSIAVNGAPVVSVPIAVCLFFMMYPIMVKIDFASVIKAGRSGKPVWLTLFVNWAIKPFTMYGIALLFLGVLFRGLIGAEATDLVKMPLGLDPRLGGGRHTRGGHGRAARRGENASSAAVAQLLRGLHSSRHRAVYGHGAGMGLSGAG